MFDAPEICLCIYLYCVRVIVRVCDSIVACQHVHLVP